MTTDRDVLEAAARGVAVMVHYHNGPKTKQAKGLMIAEVQSVAGWAGTSGLDDGAVQARIVSPVRAGLFIRYGAAEADRLFGEFTAAFDGGRGLMLRKA